MTEWKYWLARGWVPALDALVCAVQVFDLESAMVNVWVALDSTIVTTTNWPDGTAAVTGMMCARLVLTVSPNDPQATGVPTATRAPRAAGRWSSRRRPPSRRSPSVGRGC